MFLFIAENQRSDPSALSFFYYYCIVFGRNVMLRQDGEW